MTHKHPPMKLPMKLPMRLSAAVVALACVASAVGAGGQVVDHDKVVEDPQLDYRKFNKEIAAGEKAETSHQAAAVSSVALSVGADEAAFHASLAAEAQSLNAAAPPTGIPAEATDASAAPAASEAPHGLSAGGWIGLGIAGLVAVLLAVLGVSSLGRRKSRRRRHRPADEKPVSLVDFARKPDPDKTPDNTGD